MTKVEEFIENENLKAIKTIFSTFYPYLILLTPVHTYPFIWKEKKYRPLTLLSATHNFCKNFLPCKLILALRQKR
jgi:hypothetical protein